MGRYKSFIENRKQNMHIPPSHCQKNAHKPDKTKIENYTTDREKEVQQLTENNIEQQIGN